MGHTPGPWRASEGWPSDIWHVDMPGRKWSVPVARHDEDDDMPVEEVQANARLISAAPDLLAACQTVAHDLQAALDGDDFGGMPDAELFRAFLNVLRPAIAKAEGTDGQTGSLD